MKTRFSTLDIIAAIPEIQERLQGMRVVNVYDVDNKTYLIKLAKPDMKATLLIESGNRIHMTDFEWPKNMTPSGFTMKLRKHIRSRRMEKIQQLGIDRIIDIQFGSGEAAYHVILELYDRGNLVLTDFEYNILNILRPRTDESQDVRFAVREKYPIETARQPEGLIGEERLREILMAAKEGDNLRKVLNPHLVYGPAVLDHCLRRSGLQDNAQIGKQFRPTDGDDFQKLCSALKEAEELLNASRNHKGKGYIIQKKEKKPGTVEEGEEQFMFTNIEFHPVRFVQHESSPIQEYDSFNQAVDDFFSKLGTQKLDMKALQLEKTALKKLENVKKDHEKRLGQLQKEQEFDMRKAELIEINLPLVERALTIVRSAVANQIDWTEINSIVKEAQAQGDPVACAIRALKLDTNHFTLMLKDPYIDEDEEDGSGKPIKVDIDLSLSAYANARRYFDQKRYAAKKEQKTIDASSKALKSAEKKTKQTLKDVATVVKINKARKTHWFEKFLWFISSENYIVVGGRDQQQNEFIVKKHLRAGDIYVHADLHGASSVVIKNPSGEPVPPKTLNEAGTMAVCNSAAWDAKVVTSAWWVYHHQVSKTAPAGEYLTTGSFMIRGKKNFLPPCYLVYGFGIMFKVDEDSYDRHKDERKVRTTEDAESIIGDAESELSEPSQDLDTGSFNSDSEEGSQEGSELGRDQEEDSETVATLENSVTNGENAVTSTDSVANAMGVTITAADGQQAVGDNKSENLLSSGEASSVKDEQDGVREEGKESSEDEEEEMEFPDTSISLQHVKGDKFTLQRNPSNSTTASAEDDEMQEGADDDDDHDGDAAGLKKQAVRLSAKQRREMKKKARLERLGEETEQQNDEDAGGENRPSSGSKKNREKGTQNQPDAPQPKRGQKSKMKKIKSKYGDQDEEERQLRMDILASAGAQKEEKKKGKKSKQKQQQMKQNQVGRPMSGPKQGGKQPGKPPGKPQVQGAPPGGVTSIQASRETELEGKMQQLDVRDGENVKVKEEDKKVEGGAEEAAEEEDQSQVTEDVNLLTSLTGIPDPEDSLLYCIPVCGPYSSLLQYKYKVKLIPGSTKRGKACKLAMNVFMHEKTATNTEKDLLRVVKDTDVSRNMPGKVKVAAQGVNKGKMKGK